MCNVFIEKNKHEFVCNYSKLNIGETSGDNFLLGMYETAVVGNETVCMLHIDENFNISLPMNENMIIKMEPLPKAIYLLFLRHPEGILLKHISDYRAELESIYRKVSRRQNPTVIRRLLGDVTNPANNMLNKNLSIIRAKFLEKLPPDAAQLFSPIRNRAREQYVLLDTSYMKLPEILC